MELLGSMSSREWNSLGGIFSSDHQESNHDDHDQYMVPNHDLLGNIGASSLEFPFPICSYDQGDYEAYYSDDHQPVSLVTSSNNIIRNADLYNLNIDCDHHDHHDHDHHQSLKQGMVSDEPPSRNSKKRPRNASTTSTDYDQCQKSKRNVRPRKNKRLASSDEEDDSSSSANLPEELGGMASSSSPALNMNGKSRASRGSATDPQSVYARKRREKINERLRMLQNLVPNGTKVDISTMLEEAVDYVKFLQLQIKLLSSNDLWMYAPLAYNGMSVGIDLSLAIPRQH